MKPLLSILIATRNRISYCQNVIEAILSFDYSNFELVIQDNSDSQELHEYVKKNIVDSRLVYNYTPPPFSSIDNFNAVIGLAKGEYLCLIGDDDGINPEIFKIVEWAGQNNIEAITPGLNVMYRWPDACAVLKGYESDNGELSVHGITGNVSIHDTSTAVNKLMNNGGQNYLSLHFPKLYHGIVKKDNMEKIKEQTGHYVGGLSPDIYIAVALTCFIKNIIEIDYPFTIPGVCATPIIERHRGFSNLEDAPHFRDRGAYSWSCQVPRFYCPENIWAESSLASLKDMKRNQLLKQFNVTYLSAFLIKNHEEYEDLIMQNYFRQKNASKSILKWYYKKLLMLKKTQIDFINISERAFNKIIRITTKAIKPARAMLYTHQSFKNVENMSKANETLCAYLLKHSLSINQMIRNIDKELRFNVNK